MDAHVAPLALSGLAFTTVFLGAHYANLFTATTLIGLVFFFGGLVQFLVGLWEHRSGNSMHATTFATYGVFWLAYGATLYLNKLPTGNELSYFFLAWTILAGIVFLSTMRAHLAHVGIFLFFFLTFLALTIGAFGNSSTFNHIGGWLGIITAIIVWYTMLGSSGASFTRNLPGM
jgi:succinate-acetate transporter protein